MGFQRKNSRHASVAVGRESKQSRKSAIHVKSTMSFASYTLRLLPTFKIFSISVFKTDIIFSIQHSTPRQNNWQPLLPILTVWLRHTNVSKINWWMSTNLTNGIQWLKQIMTERVHWHRQTIQTNKHSHYINFITMHYIIHHIFHIFIIRHRKSRPHPNTH